MLFEDIVTRIMLDLKLSSDTARDLVGQSVNTRYRQIMRRLGLDVYRRVEFDFDCTAGQQEQTIPAGNDPEIVRIKAIYTQVDETTRALPLDYVDYDEMKQTVPMSGGTPTKWTRKRINGAEQIFLTDSLDPGTVVIEGEEMLSELETGDEPPFNVDFHELLIFGGKADYLTNMEKPQPAMAKGYETKFADGLNELALKAVIAAHADIMQNRKARRVWRRGTRGV